MRADGANLIKLLRSSDLLVVPLYQRPDAGLSAERSITLGLGVP